MALAAIVDGRGGDKGTAAVTAGEITGGGSASACVSGLCNCSPRYVPDQWTRGALDLNFPPRTLVPSPAFLLRRSGVTHAKGRE